MTYSINARRSCRKTGGGTVVPADLVKQPQRVTVHHQQRLLPLPQVVQSWRRLRLCLWACHVRTTGQRMHAQSHRPHGDPADEREHQDGHERCCGLDAAGLGATGVQGHRRGCTAGHVARVVGDRIASGVDVTPVTPAQPAFDARDARQPTTRPQPDTNRGHDADGYCGPAAGRPEHTRSTPNRDSRRHRDQVNGHQHGRYPVIEDADMAPVGPAGRPKPSRQSSVLY